MFSKNIQMGKQGVLLKDGVDLPSMRRNVIDPHTVKGDVSRRGRREAAMIRSVKCGLATAAGAKQ